MGVGPGGRAVTHCDRLTRRVDRQFIMVALDHQGAISDQYLDLLHHRHRVCAITHEITQQGKPSCPLRARVRESGVQRLNIGVDIGQQGQLHAGSTTLRMCPCRGSA